MIRKTRYILAKKIQRVNTMCFGGSPKITSPPPPPPPPQLAKVPDAALIRKKVDDMAIGQGGMPSTTLLTGPQGDPLAVNQLNKKTLLGG